MPSTDRWSIRSGEAADACGSALCRALNDVALTALAMWLAHYRRLEHALLEQNHDEVIRPHEHRPEDTLSGFDQLGRITEAEHFYARWLRNGYLP